MRPRSDIPDPDDLAGLAWYYWLLVERVRSVNATGEEKQLVMAPTTLQQFIQLVRQAFERHTIMGESPVLLTSPAIRPYVRSIIERFRPITTVMSQNEIHARARIRTLGQI